MRIWTQGVWLAICARAWAPQCQMSPSTAQCQIWIFASCAVRHGILRYLWSALPLLGKVLNTFSPKSHLHIFFFCDCSSFSFELTDAVSLLYVLQIYSLVVTCLLEEYFLSKLLYIWLNFTSTFFLLMGERGNFKNFLRYIQRTEKGIKPIWTA